VQSFLITSLQSRTKGRYWLSGRRSGIKIFKQEARGTSRRLRYYLSNASGGGVGPGRPSQGGSADGEREKVEESQFSWEDGESCLRHLGGGGAYGGQGIGEQFVILSLLPILAKGESSQKGKKNTDYGKLWLPKKLSTELANCANFVTKFPIERSSGHVAAVVREKTTRLEELPARKKRCAAMVFDWGACVGRSSNTCGRGSKISEGKMNERRGVKIKDLGEGTFPTGEREGIVEKN